MRDHAAGRALRLRCDCRHAALEPRAAWRRWECHQHGRGLRVRALSLTNPYPHFILSLPPKHRKDIENRTKSVTSTLGPLLICASASVTEVQWASALDVARRAGVPENLLPEFGSLPAMGLVGAVVISEVLPKRSLFDDLYRWKFQHHVGYVLSKSAPLPFRKMPGEQSVFSVDLTESEESVLVAAGIVP